MTIEEREVIENFALRQANRVLLEDLLGKDIFVKIQSDRLGEREQAFLLHLALQEETELHEYSKINRHPKINRLLENAMAVKKILGR
jgi:hypothetical protein